MLPDQYRPTGPARRANGGRAVAGRQPIAARALGLASKVVVVPAPLSALVLFTQSRCWVFPFRPDLFLSYVFRSTCGGSCTCDLIIITPVSTARACFQGIYFQTFNPQSDKTRNYKQEIKDFLLFIFSARVQLFLLIYFDIFNHESQ